MSWYRFLGVFLLLSFFHVKPTKTPSIYGPWARVDRRELGARRHRLSRVEWRGQQIQTRLERGREGRGVGSKLNWLRKLRSKTRKDGWEIEQCGVADHGRKRRRWALRRRLSPPPLRHGPPRRQAHRPWQTRMPFYHPIFILITLKTLIITCYTSLLFFNFWEIFLDWETLQSEFLKHLSFFNFLFIRDFQLHVNDELVWDNGTAFPEPCIDRIADTVGKVYPFCFLSFSSSK